MVLNLENQKIVKIESEIHILQFSKLAIIALFWKLECSYSVGFFFYHGLWMFLTWSSKIGNELSRPWRLLLDTSH